MIYTHTHTHRIFFTHSFIDGHLGSFHVLTIVNFVAMNIQFIVSFQVRVRCYTFFYQLMKFLHGRWRKKSNYNSNCYNNFENDIPWNSPLFGRQRTSFGGRWYLHKLFTICFSSTFLSLTILYVLYTVHVECLKISQSLFSD